MDFGTQQSSRPMVRGALAAGALARAIASAPGGGKAAEVGGRGAPNLRALTNSWPQTTGGPRDESPRRPPHLLPPSPKFVPHRQSRPPAWNQADILRAQYRRPSAGTADRHVGTPSGAGKFERLFSEPPSRLDRRLACPACRKLGFRAGFWRWFSVRPVISADSQSGGFQRSAVGRLVGLGPRPWRAKWRSDGITVHCVAPLPHRHRPSRTN